MSARSERRRADRAMRRAGITPPPEPTEAELVERALQAKSRELLAQGVIAWAAVTPATELIANLDVGHARAHGYELDVDELNVIEGGRVVDSVHGIPELTTPTIIRVDAVTPSGHPITVAITATITPRS